MPRLLFALLACLIASPLLAVERELDLFAQKQDGYHTFRIPALVAAKDGTILAFAEGRKNSTGDSGDVDLVLKRSTDGGKTWSKLQLVADAGVDTYGNACPVLDRDTGHIWLPFCWNHGKNTVKQNKLGTGEGTREVYLCFSDDHGATWSKPEKITSQVKRDDWTWYATGPGCGIQLKDGRLVIPCNHRVSGKPEKNSLSHIIYSDDHGKSWQIGGIVPEEMTNEAQVVELSNGDLLLNMRSHHGKSLRAVSTSKDRGATWSEVAFDENLIDATCQASLLRLPPGKDGQPRIAFCNANDPMERQNLTLRISHDDCRTWPIVKPIYTGSSAYSSLVALPDGSVGCAYEKDKFAKIAFARIRSE
jgi:sialidase-1